MKFSDIKTSVLSQLEVSNDIVHYISGRPGGGKSACAREIAKALAEKLGITSERIVEFNPSLREPADILGLPTFDSDHTKWMPPAEFWALRDGVGPCILIIEELSDADMGMQNPMCRVILDRYAGQLKLSDQLYIIATGNRTEDKSGANRLSTKLANRLRTLSYDEDLDDWLEWAREHGMPSPLQAFLQFRPNLLSDFDPSRSANPTPRSWESVGRIPTSMPTHLFQEHVSGSVGEGAAAEYCGFLRLINKVPNLNDILADGLGVEIPSGRDVQWATIAALVSKMNKKNLHNVWTFCSRLSPDMAVAAAKMMLASDSKLVKSAKTPEGTEVFRDITKTLLSSGVL